MRRRFQIQNADLLETFAEVSVAFAGFAGVVSALGRSRLHHEAQSFRLQSMIRMALFTLLFSILPLLTDQLGLSESHAWRICSLLLALGLVANTYVGVRGFNRLLRARRASNRYPSMVIAVFTAGFVAALFFNGLGALPVRDSGVYLVGLSWALAISSYHFAKLVFAIQPSEE